MVIGVQPRRVYHDYVISVLASDQADDELGVGVLQRGLTEAVTRTPYRSTMKSQALQPGDELLCPHCRRWHRLVTTGTEGTPYAVAMLFFECAKKLYYGGQVGGSSRFATKRAVDWQS
jgi:hypothetical protein